MKMAKVTTFVDYQALKDATDYALSFKTGLGSFINNTQAVDISARPDKNLTDTYLLWLMT